MDRMTQLEEMAKEHGGVLKASMVVSAGISKPTFASLPQNDLFP